MKPPNRTLDKNAVEFCEEQQRLLRRRENRSIYGHEPMKTNRATVRWLAWGEARVAEAAAPLSGAWAESSAGLISLISDAPARRFESPVCLIPAPPPCRSGESQAHPPMSALKTRLSAAARFVNTNSAHTHTTTPASSRAQPFFF